MQPEILRFLLDSGTQLQGDNAEGASFDGPRLQIPERTLPDPDWFEHADETGGCGGTVADLFPRQTLQFDA